MDDEKRKLNSKGGRRPKTDPAVHRYSISLNAEENARFLTLFEQSGMYVIAHFITACIFEKTVKTIKVDKNTLDFCMRLTGFYSQFRSVGVNYNQIVKLLYRNFSEKKAAAYLFKLEKQTIEMSSLCKKVVEITKEFEQQVLKKEV